MRMNLERQSQKAAQVREYLSDQNRIQCVHQSRWGMDHYFDKRAVTDFEFDLEAIDPSCFISAIIEQAVLYGIKVGREEKRQEVINVLKSDDNGEI